MSTVVKDLGAVSAYAYAVEKGYTGTEAEFAELMASYADVGQTAVDAKDAAVAAKTAAETAANTATTKATEASQSASAAGNSADQAAQSASQAQTSAQTASTKASEASQSATTASTKASEATTAASNATTAKDDAVTAKTAAQAAQTAAETAQGAAETAAASVSASAAQIATNTSDITDLKEDLSSINAIVGNPNVCEKSAVIQAKSTVVYIARDITVKAGSKYTITFSIPSAVANAVYCYVKSNGTNIATANISVGTTSASVTLKPTTDITDLALATQVTKDALVGLEVTCTVIRQDTDYISENADNISDIKAVLGDGVFSKVGYTLEVGGLSGTIGSQITFSESTNYNRTCISVSAGELYKVTANVNANVDYPSAYFTDDNDIVVGTALGESLSVAAVVSEVAEAPTGATKLYVRDRNGIATSTLSIGKLDKNISEIVSELREGDYLEIPEYYVTHMESKVDTINDIANVNVNTSVTRKANQLLQFVFFTDYHYDGTGTAYDNTQNSASLIEYLQKNIGVDFVCHGGDIINNKGTQKEAIQYINAFRDKFGRVDNLYCCIGNHEYNSTAELTWAQITKLLNGNKTGIDSMDSYGDFCVDDKATKTRYIFMGCDRRSTSGAMISSGQISWFLESLADAPNDYDCLLFIHRILELSFDTSTETINASVYSDCEPIANGIDAYNGHTSVTYNGVTYDYSGKGGHFICALSGHSHTDTSLTLPNGTPLIMVTTDCRPKRHTSYDWANGAWKNQATRGTTEEQAFDVVTVDKEHRKIYCTRIGYGTDRAFTY